MMIQKRRQSMQNMHQSLLRIRDVDLMIIGSVGFGVVIDALRPVQELLFNDGNSDVVHDVVIKTQKEEPWSEKSGNLS